MVKKKKVPQDGRAVASKTNDQSLPASPQSAEFYKLSAAHCLLTAPYRHGDKGMLELTESGSSKLYLGIQPKTALEAILASLIVGISNASNECLAQATQVTPDHVQFRDVNLRHALKGATVVTQLIEALERVRGNGPRNVSVGNVNVQSGGQAIVGNVQAGQRGEEVSAPDSQKAGESKKTGRIKA